jgi:predicted HicB family RNase H-like nuclease
MKQQQNKETPHSFIVRLDKTIYQSLKKEAHRLDVSLTYLLNSILENRYLKGKTKK